MSRLEFERSQVADTETRLTRLKSTLENDLRELKEIAAAIERNDEHEVELRSNANEAKRNHSEHQLLIENLGEQVKEAKKKGLAVFKELDTLRSRVASMVRCHKRNDDLNE